MKRPLLLLILSFLLGPAGAQQQRLDSLLGVLKTQPEAKKAVGRARKNKELWSGA
ncbi:MAG: hypothetical protein KA175_09310 [Flavobacteriales bacterium]|nr:hypothetical protein [Flavobacteriales bacterium]MBP6697804.1 hypothetical protein [Flavobacteriales bacterium]